jgi:hypothetical protein
MAMHATKIIEQYEQLTGEKFQAALIRLAKLGHTGEEAAHFIGFCDKQRLDIVIKRLGYEPVQFRRIKRRGMSKSSIKYHKAKERHLREESQRNTAT